MKIEVIVPVRPGGCDKYPLVYPGVDTYVVECADANLSRVWRDSVMASDADIVVFKHDDLWVRDPLGYLTQVAGLIAVGVINVVGVAGTRMYAPMRETAWWRQGDRTTLGLVHHQVVNQLEYPSFFGPPGPAVVVDGCIIAVRTRSMARDLWDVSFKNHFYDVAFCVNQELLHPNTTRVIISDIKHDSLGMLSPAWYESSARYIKSHRSVNLCA